ncbi:unnamed protein product [Bursaphelenchus xylophilus]|uniref:alpha-1,2-Mannosidase n=1 Tax=Bursaphelenchus xylophilus TaxID=6326 RepID=A0A1I7RNE7_BURXY|nr:unnamed protein product [Bursaphelenchus xylophilus]CAG9123939.1 unnamed protein product [Bursaphelenchus xylophilus]
MRTVFPNNRAVALVSLIAFAVFVLTILHLSQSDVKDFSRIALPRDVQNRRKLEEGIDHKDVNQKEGQKQDAVPNIAIPDVEKSANKDVDNDAGNGEGNPDDDIVEPKQNPELDSNKESNVEEADKAGEKVNVVAEPPKPQPIDLENAHRREFIKNMTKHAWAGYRKHAWGYNEVKPISKRSHNQPIFGGEKMGATIVDGADTLYIMGLHEEYEQAKDFIKNNFSIHNAKTASTFETTIRFTGGLLSLYALTKDPMYIDKAVEVSDALLPAFNTKTGIAMSLVDVPGKSASNYGWVMSLASILSEFGSLHLEYLYLSKLTGKNIYEEKVQRIRDVLEKIPKKDGLYYNYVDPKTGEFVGSHVSLGALGDSFYEYLIKSYIHTEKQDKQAYYMYRNASDAIQKKMVFTSKSGLKYVAELRRDNAEHKMSHLSCFCPGMFALEADVEQDLDRKRKVMQLAEDLGHTCHESYARAPTGIGPEMFYFNADEDATSKRGENGFILRPEAIEGWFYLWRLTKNEKYKTWIWDAIVAVDRYCKKEDGYVGLKNVYNPDAGFDDVQQSFFIAETIKYAYLTFADDEIPLSKWVFNTEAHPFPIGFGDIRKPKTD